MTSDALDLRFRPAGVGRWLEAGFLSVWLTGWALGEVFVLAVLGRGIRALLQGRMPPGQPSSPLALLPVGAFLLVWLSFWTVGGVLALRQWLRCFWAQDRLILTATDLEIRRWLGPWRQRRRLQRETIRAVRLAPRGSGHPRALIAQLENRQVELTRLGSPEQRAQAAERLQQALEAAGIATTPQPAAMATLPPDWECEQVSFDCSLLVPARRRRRGQLLALLLLALPLDAGVLLLLRQLPDRLDLLPGLLMLGLFAALASWGVLWLLLGRQDWRLGQGELVARRGFAGQVRELFAARGLELRDSTDEDGDRWYALVLTELQPLASNRPPAQADTVLCRSLREPGDALALGRWLSQRCHIPFDDVLPSEEEREALRRSQLRQLTSQLRAGGRLGRWLAGRLETLD